MTKTNEKELRLTQGVTNCHQCKNLLKAGEYEMFQIEVGGPNDGCEEFADEWITVGVCKTCMKE